MAKLGFVGTGTMGSPMAARLLEGGHDLVVHDRQPGATDVLRDLGASVAGSAAEAADGAACVLLSLPGPEQVADAVTADAGVLAAPSLPEAIVDLSTNAVDVVRHLHRRCAEAGVAFVDAPVSGGLAKARTGTLSVMVGADDADHAAVAPYLALIGEHVFHVGPPGAGTAAKLVNNAIFLGAAALVQEAFVLAASSGLDPSALQPVLKASSAAPYVALAPMLLGRRFDDVVFRLDIAAKDLDLAVASGRAGGAELPVTAAAARLYADAVAAGSGAEVFHATLKELERRAGLELPPLTRRAP